jgi:hypothetical protein
MLTDYAKYWEEAGKYLRIAKGGLDRPKIFTPEILYNLLGLSIEKFFMAAMMRHGDLADNHTFSDLVDSAARIRPVDASLAANLKEAETYQNICPAFDGYMRKDIPREAILKMIDTTEEVKGWADSTINSVPTPG